MNMNVQFVYGKAKDSACPELRSEQHIHQKKTVLPVGVLELKYASTGPNLDYGALNSILQLRHVGSQLQMEPNAK